MLMKNCDAFDFTHKQIFKTLTRDNLGGGPVHLHTLHILKATTEIRCKLCHKRGIPFTLSIRHVVCITGTEMQSLRSLYL